MGIQFQQEEEKVLLSQHCADIAGNSKPFFTQVKQLGREGKHTRVCTSGLHGPGLGLAAGTVFDFRLQ